MKQFQDLAKIIHKEGYVFLILFAAATFLLSSFSSILGMLGFIMTIYCGYFFRNPERVTPTKESLVISPADGIVQRITIAPPPPELNFEKEEMLRISIFLNIFNVHVNRIPATGKILTLNYHPGKFLNASLDKASIHNERQTVLMETTSGEKIIFTQIAGLIAKRIVCDLSENEKVLSGQRFGIIRFGSRMDVYLPVETKLMVTEGQVSIGGETILADLASKAKEKLEFAIRN